MSDTDNWSAALMQAIMLTINHSRYNDAFNTLLPALKETPTNPAAIATMSMILTLKAASQLSDSLDRNTNAILQAIDPVQAHVSSEFLGRKKGHANVHYLPWRTARLNKLLELTGSHLLGKTALVLGDGPGLIGGFIAALGATVTALEGRQQLCTLANLRYGQQFGYNYQARCVDLNQDFSGIGKFDFVVAFGVMEVLTDLDRFMASCAAVADDIIVETLVCDSTNDKYMIDVMLEGHSDDNPLSGNAVRPSPFYIERVFREHGFSTERHFDSALNAVGHTYDWEHKNSGAANETSRRFWRFRKNRT